MMNKPQYEVIDRVEMPGCQVLTVRGVWARPGVHWTIVNGDRWIAPSGRTISVDDVSPGLVEFIDEVS